MPSQEEIDRMSEILKEQEARYLDERNLEVAEKNKIDKEELEKFDIRLKPTHPLESVLQDCLYQVTGGKGNERHGNGRDFMDQPWKHIADIHGVGFLTGQAAKKLDEAQGFEDIDRWLREMYGVIAYSAMAILYRTEIEDEY